MKNEESGMKNFYLNKMFVLAVILFTTCVPGFADDHRGRLQIGTGLLYEQGMDLTVAYVHIPADTRSAFPVISVQSPVSIQCCWQS